MTVTVPLGTELPTGAHSSHFHLLIHLFYFLFFAINEIDLLVSNWVSLVSFPHIKFI